jgi:ribosomal protein L22
LVVHSAAANAKHNYGLDKKTKLMKFLLMKDSKLKRIRPRAQGRAFKILTDLHITVMKAIK